jgi:hypothetical protein
MFFNIHGDPIDLTKAAPPKTKKAKADVVATHKGWLAVGFSPKQIDDARAHHRKSGGDEPFSQDSYMRKATPTKIRVQPYFSQEAAQQACALAERSGWLNTHTRPVVKGGHA